MIATLPIRVLLVEDNPGDARLFREYLADARGERFDVVATDCVAAAERELGASSFDIVLLDLSLPDGVGLETVTRMLRSAPALPIVVLTGTDDETLALRTVQSGAQDYLVKGAVSTDLLVRTIRYAIERRKALEAERREAEASSLARRSHFLAEGGRALAASLDFDTLLRTIGRLVVPQLADLCFVDLVDGETIRRRTVGWTDAIGEETALLLDRYPPRLDDVHNPSIEAMRNGQLARIRIDDALVAGSAPPVDQRQLWNDLGACSAIIAPLQARGRTFGTLIAVDVAEREAAGAADDGLFEELAQHAALALDNALLYRRQQDAVRTREDIVSVVSHDLRNPLNVVTMTTALLGRELREHPAQRLVERIERATEQMGRLISDLLDVARIENGTFSVEPKQESPAALVAAAVDLLRPLAASRSLTLETSCSDTLAPVAADRARVLQVLSNLIGNAIKFTPAGGCITVAAAARDGAIRFEVRDTGPGIPREHLGRVFDRFWQARRNDRQGAGLGLAIAKAIVDAHRGQIGVDSDSGCGACFHFTLPLASPARITPDVSRNALVG